MIKGIYAHRGFHNKPDIPENSIAAFKRAIDRGWGAELDVHLIKDGSLVVFHDSELERCTGIKGIIEDLTLEQVKKLRLEGTDERVPTFDEVLSMFENVQPLIIELKAYGGNHFALTEAVCKRLDSYEGEFVIESFDPRVLMDLKKLRPNIYRGQLAQDFVKRPENLPWYQRVLLTNLGLNFLTKPNFIAYRFEDREVKANRRAIKHGIQEVCWTIASKKDFETVLSNGAIPIFERFDPEIDPESLE